MATTFQRSTILLAGAAAAVLLAGCPQEPENAVPTDDPLSMNPATSPENASNSSAPTGGAGTVGSTGQAGTPADGPRSDGMSSGPGGSGQPSSPDPAPPQNDTRPFVNSPASIVVRDGGPRTDPEGVAPPAAGTTLLTWRDARGRERTMTLGAYLYQYDFSFDDGMEEVTRSANDDAWGHEGFGYVVSHNSQNGNSPIGKANAATNIERIVFAGGHHAIYRVEMLYDRDKEAGGYGIKIPVVIEWMVATGRDHPIWAVNWKTGEAINPAGIDFNAYRMDTRGPYGSLNFDGAPTRAQGDAIGNIAWGDFGRRFRTLDNQLTLQSPWDYTAPNRVPFTYASAANTNAEMGIVCTAADDREMGLPDRVYGRERGASSETLFADRGDCSGYGDNRAYAMPCIQGWPYQLMNFDWDPSTGKPITEATGTKLIAWGTPYGYLGASAFDLFDYSGTADGRGDRAYATFVVLGPKGRYSPDTRAFDRPGDVSTILGDVESLADATISDVSIGSVVSQVPRGPNSSQARQIRGGYNSIYATHHLRVAADGVAFTFAPGGGPIRNPIFVIEDYAGRRLPSVTVDGAPITVNEGLNPGAFVSLDETGNRLWMTLNRTLAGPVSVRVVP